MISKELESTLNIALKEAKRRRHEYVCLEHLLYALLQDKDASGASSIAAVTSTGSGKAWRSFSTDRWILSPKAWTKSRSRRSAFTGFCRERLSMLNRRKKRKSTGATY